MQSDQWRWPGVVVRLVAVVLGWSLLYAPIDIVVRRRHATRGAPLAPSVRLALEAASLLAACLVATGLLRIDRCPLHRLLGPARGALTGSLIGLGLGVLWTAVTVCALWLGGQVRVEHAGSAWASSVALLGAATLLNAAAQEVVFRGYPFALLEKRAGPKAALVASTALFVALHLGAAAGAPLALLNLVAAGTLMGALRFATGALWAPIALHFAWNFLVGPVAGLAVSGSRALDAGAHLLSLRGAPLWTGGSFGIEGSLATTATTLGMLSALWAFDRRYRATHSGAAGERSW